MTVILLYRDEYQNILRKFNGVLLDTSIIIQAIENKIDLILELRRLTGLEIYIPDIVIYELNRLSEKNKKLSKIIKIANKLLKNNVKIIKTEDKSVDNAIIRIATNNNYIVATNDAHLKRTLKKLGLMIIYINKDGYLSMD